MVPGLPSQLQLRVDSKHSAGSPRCGAPTAPACRAAAQEKKKPCYVPRDHAGGSTTLGLRWSLVGGSMTDATLRHMTFRHRPHADCTQPRGMHTRSASLLSCRLALSYRFAAPLEFTRAQGRPVQRHDAADARNQSSKDTDQHEQHASVDLAVQPSPCHQFRSNADLATCIGMRVTKSRYRGACEDLASRRVSEPGVIGTWRRIAPSNGS